MVRGGGEGSFPVAENRIMTGGKPKQKTVFAIPKKPKDKKICKSEMRVEGWGIEKLLF
jgi:hypothetical protein